MQFYYSLSATPSARGFFFRNSHCGIYHVISFDHIHFQHNHNFHHIYAYDHNHEYLKEKKFVSNHTSIERNA